jgi:hypothetical protein
MGGWVVGEAYPAPDEPSTDRNRPRKPVLVAGAVGLLVVAGAGLGVGIALTAQGPAPKPADTAAAPGTRDPTPTADRTVTGTAGTPTAPDTGGTGTVTAAQQAKALDRLLEVSAADRLRVVEAVNDVLHCVSVGDAREKLTEAAENRERLVSRLDALAIDSIDGGPDAVSQLRSAWRHSAEADGAFADWAGTAEGCTSAVDVPRGEKYDSGGQNSSRATRAKKAFVKQWNPIAEKYGLASRADDEL